MFVYLICIKNVLVQYNVGWFRSLPQKEVSSGSWSWDPKLTMHDVIPICCKHTWSANQGYAHRSAELQGSWKGGSSAHQVFQKKYLFSVSEFPFFHLDIKPQKKKWEGEYSTRQFPTQEPQKHWREECRVWLSGPPAETLRSRPGSCDPRDHVIGTTAGFLI